MRIDEATVLVSGANRGLGRAICAAFVERGARRVYAGARDPGQVVDAGVVPIALDITDPASVAAAAKECSDVTILVNNAGIARATPILSESSEQDARDLIETNYFGTLRMSRAFAPVLADNGGGALVTMLSIASFFAVPGMATFCATKAALWSLTNAMRIELRDQGTLVTSVHASFIDTDMAAGFDVDKLAPSRVAAAILDGIESGTEEVLVDEPSRQAKANLSRDQELIYPRLEREWRQTAR